MTDKTEMPKIIRIDKVADENPTVKTFYFRHKIDYKPGQFLMIWVPGVDEKPFSVSQIDDKGFAVTVEKKGGFTEAMHNLKAGDKIGIRGPYGNPFTIKKGKTCVIGGGCGIAPIMPLVQRLDDPTVILGCQNKDRLMFHDKIKKYHVCTDDGSAGFKGFTTQKFEELLSKEKFDFVYACGPEMMMKAVFDICEKHKIPMEASLERFMICGIGICGQCMCDNLRICQDGPVIPSEKLRKLKDFGRSAMIKTGKKVSLKEYYAYRTKYSTEVKGCGEK